jgi:hypothetical protein
MFFSLCHVLERGGDCGRGGDGRIKEGMREEWKEDPLGGYRENARHLFGYPESTLAEYVRDLRAFSDG